MWKNVMERFYLKLAETKKATNKIVLLIYLILLCSFRINSLNCNSFNLIHKFLKNGRDKFLREEINIFAHDRFI